MMSALEYSFSTSGANKISTTFRVKVCSWVRYVFLITCWVIVLPPWVILPRCFTRARAARVVAIQSTPVWVLKRLSSCAMYAFWMFMLISLISTYS